MSLYSLPLVLSLLAAAQGDTTVVQVPELVVSASRTREPLLRTPAAVSVVDRARFASGRGLSLGDALAGVPGVFVQDRAGAQDVRITIRGYGARGNGERSNTGNMRGIRVLTDGIPVTEPDGRTNLDLIDIGSADRIEVSRSNASALYGNASGGVVDLRTRLDFTQPYLRTEFAAGSYGMQRLGLAAGFTAGRGRGVVKLTDGRTDGWREHSDGAATHAHVRFAAPLGEGASDRLLLLADFGRTLIRFPGALTSTEHAADPEQAYDTFVTRDERRYHRAGRFAATLEHALPGDQSLSVSAWVEPKVQQRSERNKFRDFTRYHVGGNAVWSLDRDFGDVRGRTSVGVDEAWMDGSILFWNVVDGKRGPTNTDNKREGANSAGTFVQQSLTWDGWSVQAALRYDNLWYIAQDFLSPSKSASRHFTRVTPKLTLRRALGEATVWAAMGGGVEAPAFNEIDPPPTVPATALNPLLDPMRSTTWEVGARGRLVTGVGPLTYDAAAFLIRTSDEIVPWNGGSYFFTAGRSTRSGLEAGLAWRPSSRLGLRGTADYMRAEYDEYTNDLGDFSGNRVPGLPELRLSGSAQVTLVEGLAFTLTGERIGALYSDDANTLRAPGYTLVHATARYEMSTEGAWSWSAFASVRNLLDERHVASVFINPVVTTGVARWIEPGLPRSFTAGVTIGL